MNSYDHVLSRTREVVMIDDLAMVDGYSFFFFQAEDGIRDLVRSRGLGDVYKRQIRMTPMTRY